MNLLKLIMLGLLVTLVACSSKSNQNAEEDLNESVVMEDEINEELDELEGIDITDEADAGEIVAEAAEEEMMSSDEITIDENFASETPTPVTTTTGDLMEYTVQKNDTLMWIAFKVYGDYGMWKKIRAANPGIKNTGLAAGTKIVYEAPAERFAWNPKGSPYLIVNGDTLGKVSTKVYGNTKKWRSIWNNNKPMIKDPNLIFAGFTLYYLPDGDLAINVGQ